MTETQHPQRMTDSTRINFRDVVYRSTHRAGFGTLEASALSDELDRARASEEALWTQARDAVAREALEKARADAAEAREAKALEALGEAEALVIAWANYYAMVYEQKRGGKLEDWNPTHRAIYEKIRAILHPEATP